MMESTGDRPKRIEPTTTFPAYAAARPSTIATETSANDSGGASDNTWRGKAIEAPHAELARPPDTMYDVLQRSRERQGICSQPYELRPVVNPRADCSE
jgi:hypothetical protein